MMLTRPARQLFPFTSLVRSTRAKFSSKTNLNAVQSPASKTLGLAATGALFGGLGAGFVYSSKSRVISANTDKKTGSVEASIPLVSLPRLDSSKGPEFAAEDITLVFVLGGPGVGKGTQCVRLVQELDFVHLSAGDLLREERQRPGSPYAELIGHYIKEGKIVPHEITITLLRNAMKTYPDKKRFLIDGFPRSIEQGIEFELVVCPSKLVLFFECSEEEMLKRLMSRSQHSGRSDDNIESIKKRFRTFDNSTIPVREFYNDLGKMRAINCTGSVNEVFDKTKAALKDLGLV